MSATTKSLILLAALGVAACDSSNNSVTTPAPPVTEEPVDPAPVESELETLTQGAAVAEQTADDVGAQNAIDVVVDAQATLQENIDVVAAINALVDDLIALATPYGVGQVPNAERPPLNDLVAEINDLIIDLGTGGGVLQIGGTTASDYITALLDQFGDDGSNTDAFAAFIENLEIDVTTAQSDLADFSAIIPDLGGLITLADGTVLQTAATSVYTRFDANADAETVLTPTATVIVAYEADGAGNPTSVSFYEADGIGFEGAPVGTAFASGEGFASAFVTVNGGDGVAAFGDAFLTLDFNSSTGEFVTDNMGGFNPGNENSFSMDLLADLTFDKQTGAFVSNSGEAFIDFYVFESDSFVSTSALNIALAGSLQGLSEAYSGTFTLDGVELNAVGGFAGAVETTDPNGVTTN